MNIGIDIVDNKRIATKIKKVAFLKKILSEKELEKYNSIKNKQSRIEFAAGRFSAKEAIIKATNKSLLFHKLEIINSISGMPEVYYEEKRRKDIFLSISHERKTSVSVAIIT